MGKINPDRKLFFDLNHPADFHFFKNMFHQLEDRGYSIRVMARNKECLHALLNHAGIPFVNRGAGSHFLLGKYLYAVYIIVITMIQLIRFRPGLTISLSSPYLITVSRFLRIPTMTYDDTDYNPRLLPLISRANYIFSPATYPHTFHENHFHIQTYKELAYLHPAYFKNEERGDAVFFRITRTDSVHHTSDSFSKYFDIIKEINRISVEQTTYLSSEIEISKHLSKGVLMPDKVDIHDDLRKCKALFGTSATMAAEAAVLGIPAIFVGNEKFSYMKELEDFGLIYCFTPDQIESSLKKLDELVHDVKSREAHEKLRIQLLREKIDITKLVIWFIENLPESAQTLRKDPDFHLQFKATS